MTPVVPATAGAQRRTTKVAGFPLFAGTTEHLFRTSTMFDNGESLPVDRVGVRFATGALPPSAPARAVTNPVEAT